MATSGSMTLMIARLKAGDRAAAQRLWEDYFLRVVDRARARLRSWRDDGWAESIANSVLGTLIRRCPSRNGEPAV